MHDEFKNEKSSQLETPFKELYVNLSSFGVLGEGYPSPYDPSPSLYHLSSLEAQ